MVLVYQRWCLAVAAFCYILQPVCTGIVAAAKSSSSSQPLNLDSIPWHRPADFRPPTAELVNNVEGLVRHQLDLAPSSSATRVLSVYTTSAIQPDHANQANLLNSIASLILLGRQPSYIVAGTTNEAVEACLRLRLPCANYSTFHEFHFPPFRATWTRALVASRLLAVLPADTILHSTDYDTVYLKPVIPAIEFFMQNATLGFADLSMMREEASASELNNGTRGSYVPLVNTGVVFARVNSRVKQLYERYSYAASGRRASDQPGFHRYLFRGWALCHSPYTCNAVTRFGGTAALARHNDPAYNGGGGVAGSSSTERPACPPCDWAQPKRKDAAGFGVKECSYNRDHCGVRERLYVHLFCHNHKVETLRGLGLWFLSDVNSTTPAVNASAIAAAGLPCAAPYDQALLQVV